MAGCALVGQSVMNIDNGGRTRLSTFFSGVSLLAMILLARPWLEQIPMAALVAVMISIAISTADMAGLRRLARIPVSDTAVMLMTFAMPCSPPPQPGLGCAGWCGPGRHLFSRKMAKVIRVDVEEMGPDARRYVVRGQLFFVSKIYFLQGFDIFDTPPRSPSTCRMPTSGIKAAWGPSTS